MVGGHSPYALEMHGYQKNDPPLNVTGTFLSVRVYQLVGITRFDDSEPKTDSLDEKTKFAIGNDINELCSILCRRKLNGIDEILKKKGDHPPYLITATTGDNEHTYQCEWTQEYDGILSVYNLSFRKDLDEIRLICENDLKYIPAILCSLSFPENPTTANLLYDYFCLILSDGRICQSEEDQGCFTGGPVYEKSLSDFSVEFEKLIGKDKSFPETVSRLMLFSMQEDDNLKKFLFSWNALEILITKIFSKLPKQEQEADFPDNADIPADYRESVSNLYKNKSRGRKKTNVAQKFIYLSIYKWKVSYNGHYDLFKKSKKYRDDLIHKGELKDIHILYFYSRNNLLIINNIIRSMSE
jgi:hypothetical protein